MNDCNQKKSNNGNPSNGKAIALSAAEMKAAREDRTIFDYGVTCPDRIWVPCTIQSAEGGSFTPYNYEGKDTGMKCKGKVTCCSGYVTATVNGKETCVPKELIDDGETEEPDPDDETGGSGSGGSGSGDDGGSGDGGSGDSGSGSGSGGSGSGDSGTTPPDPTVPPTKRRLL